MTAPVLGLVMPSAPEGPATITAHRIRQRLAKVHPHIETAIAFSGGPLDQPALKEEWSELVLVPMDLTHLHEVPDPVRGLSDRLEALRPDLSIRLARPLGPAPALLGLVDARLRLATHRAHTQEIDALVLSSPDTGDKRGAAMLSRLSRMWSQHHRLPVHLANDGGGAGHVDEVVHTLRREGRRHVAVGSLWVCENSAWHEHVRCATGAGAEVVSSPIGDDPLLATWAFERYCSAAMGLVAGDPADED
ncbi:MAG: cobalamin biosynthesis protein CbiX [Acidipropionibacterium acidipropionici]|nr:cobalamin biosynthesis protein CbiX [Acidipropionibacterium acidipropionici]